MCCAHRFTEQRSWNTGMFGGQQFYAFCDASSALFRVVMAWLADVPYPGASERFAFVPMYIREAANQQTHRSPLDAEGCAVTARTARTGISLGERGSIGGRVTVRRILHVRMLTGNRKETRLTHCAALVCAVSHQRHVDRPPAWRPQLARTVGGTVSSSPCDATAGERVGSGYFPGVSSLRRAELPAREQA